MDYNSYIFGGYLLVGFGVNNLYPPPPPHFTPPQFTSHLSLPPPLYWGRGFGQMRTDGGQNGGEG